MNLKNLNDQELHESGKRAVQKEREATIDVLYHLMEIDRRKLFSKWRCKSLQKYAEKEYGYPGKQAYRRIVAMKMLREFPEMTENVKNGRLSITHLNDAKELFKKKPLQREEKLKLLTQFSTLTTREAEKIIFKMVPALKVKESAKLVAEDTIEFRFTGSTNLDEMLKELKQRLAHTHPHISTGELMEMLVAKELHNLKEDKISRRRENVAKIATVNDETRPQSKADVIRQVWRRDNHECVKCKSAYALEVDHIIPKGKGGLDTLENLRLLCRNCNQRHAIEHYGQRKMNPYLKMPEIGIKM